MKEDYSEGENMMEELVTTVGNGAAGEAETIEAKEKVVRDFDEEPYGNDNLLVRASKRRAYFTSVSEF